MNVTAPRLVLLGVDFTRAPLPVRETLSFNAAQSESLLREAQQFPGLREAAIVSTCNRTEFYLVVDDEQTPELWLRLVRETRPEGRTHDATCLLTRSTDAAAAEHIFGVMCGLRSQLLGDAHIAGQVKSAFALAARCGTLGPVLSELVRQAAEAGRLARSSTDIARGAASLGSIVADQIAGHLDGTGRPLATLVLGAGTVARECARYLAKRRLGPLLFVNRTFERAAALARECGGTAHPFDELPDILGAADAVVSAVTCDRPVLTHDMASRAFSRRLGMPGLVIDLSVPRSIEPGFPSYVVGMDELVRRREHALRRRASAVPAVEEVVAAQVRAWRRWMDARSHEKLLQSLFEREASRRTEMARELAPRLGVTVESANRLLAAYARPLLRDHARALRQLHVIPSRPAQAA